jgi:hypothetical protein
MDKLYYYVRKTDEAMQKSADDLDLMTYFTGRETDDEGDGDSDGDGDGGSDGSDGDEIDLQEFADSDDEQQEQPEVVDQEQEGSDQDEEEADENDDASNSENLGDIFVSLWKKRRTKLVSDYAIAGWMLCPIKEVMEDMQGAQRDHTAEVRGGYILAVDRVIAKLFHENTAEELGVIKDTFWAEWQKFRGKTGPFYSRAYIWNSEHLRTGASHLWHQQYSIPFTNYLGKVACRVTSKILGIGSAERAWGAVKHLKTNKRAHLGCEKIKMQSTIFGAACIEGARAARHKKVNQKVLWTDEDVAFNIGLNWEEEVAPVKIPHRVFRAYFEDSLEAIHHKKDDPVSEQALLRKYGGLKCLDVDTDKVVVTSREEMHFNKGRKSRGWCVWTTDSDGHEETIELVTFIEMIQENTEAQLEEYGIILVREEIEEDEDETATEAE